MAKGEYSLARLGQTRRACASWRVRDAVASGKRPSRSPRATTHTSPEELPSPRGARKGREGAGRRIVQLRSQGKSSLACRAVTGVSFGGRLSARVRWSGSSCGQRCPAFVHHRAFELRPLSHSMPAHGHYLPSAPYPGPAWSCCAPMSRPCLGAVAQLRGCAGFSTSTRVGVSLLTPGRRRSRDEGVERYDPRPAPLGVREPHL